MTDEVSYAEIAVQFEESLSDRALVGQQVELVRKGLRLGKDSLFLSMVKRVFEEREGVMVDLARAASEDSGAQREAFIRGVGALIQSDEPESEVLLVHSDVLNKDEALGPVKSISYAELSIDQQQWLAMRHFPKENMGVFREKDGKSEFAFNARLYEQAPARLLRELIHEYGAWHLGREYGEVANKDSLPTLIRGEGEDRKELSVTHMVDLAFLALMKHFEENGTE